LAALSLSVQGIMLEGKVVLGLRYSHSQLETYENCPLKFKLQYIDRVRTGRKGIEAFMGTLVHATLERLYRDLRMSRCPDLEDLTIYYKDLWDSSFGDHIFVVRDEYCPEDYRETGLRCVNDYYRRYHPFLEGIAVWLERKVNIPIRDAEGRPLGFTGVIDRLDSLESGRYEIHDYKTSSTLPTVQDLERDRQLSLYQVAVEAAFPDAREVDLVWHYLVFDRELRLHRERSDLERITAEAAGLACLIENASEFPPREGRLCEWCEVQEYCPKRKHPFMVAKLPARELGTDQGIQLVDQYAHWEGRKREAEKHLKELREEILELSSYQGVDNLQGSNDILKISRYETPRIPSRGSERREELEKLLREGEIWEEASALSARRLGAALKEADLHEGLREELEKHITWEEVRTLRLLGKD
jgi:putative RecB family exonuclease